MSPPHQGSAVHLAIERRRSQVRDGRLTLVPPTMWHLYPIQLESTRRAIREDLTCPKCRRRVYKTLIYYDSQDGGLIAIRKCWHCKHAWEL